MTCCYCGFFSGLLCVMFIILAAWQGSIVAELPTPDQRLPHCIAGFIFAMAALAIFAFDLWQERNKDSSSGGCED